MSLAYQCPIKSCPKECKSAWGLTQHINSFHRQQSPVSGQHASPLVDVRRWTHPRLTGEQVSHLCWALLTFKFSIHSARPCDENGDYLSSGSRSQPQQPFDATPENTFHPFEDRLAFEFADFHFFEQQSSAAAIDRALQLWAAQSAKNGFDDVPWKSASNIYATIDEVRQGDNPWKSVVFRYQGSVPENPPKWMTGGFELVTRNICSVLQEQIACTDFNGHWDYVPFMEFNHAGDRI